MAEPDYWWTDDQGRPRPGYEPKKGGGLLLAVVLVAALGAGGTAGVTGAGASSGAGGSVSASGARTSSQARKHDSDRIRTRLLRQAVRVDHHFETDDDCAAHAYGQVREFFQEQPCEALHRAWFEVRDRRSGVVLVAVSWVEMPDTRSARKLHELVGTYGTGNITELSREQGRHRDVRFTGRYYEDRRDGATVINAQAEPVGRAAVAAQLKEIAAAASR